MNARTGIAMVAVTLAVAAPVAAHGVSPGPGGDEPARAARTVGVTVGDNFFSPRRLAVAPGTRVRWTWRGRSSHDVTVASGPRRFASPTQSRGTFARTLRQRGLYRIVCTLHSQRMRIRVR